MQRRDDLRLYISDMRSLPARMMAAGVIERAPETFRSKVRYRYFRKPRCGDIVALERAFVEASREGGDA